MNQTIGNPVYTQAKKNTFRLKEGDNVFRILPPFGTLASDGRWGVYSAIHWGYKSSKGVRTFRCIEQKDMKTKMIKSPCPECENIAEKKKDYESQYKQLTEVQKMPMDKAKEFLKPLNEYLFNHNLDKKWWLNVLAPDGSVGRLGIPHKSYQALQTVIASLIKKNIDPIAVNRGVYFNFQRSGTGPKTLHSVSVVTETVSIDGQSFERIKSVPLTEEIINKMKVEAWDLGNLFKTLSYDEINRIVSSGGDTEVVDSVFSAPEREVSGGDETEPTAEELSAATVPAPVTPSAVPEVVPKVLQAVEPNVTPPPLDEMAQLKARLAELEGKKPEPVPSVPNAPQVSSTPVSSMANSEFMARFGKKK